MSIWYYYDKFGNCNGPIGDHQLRDLASQGVIAPETLIKTNTGKKGLAKQIKGLFSKSSDLQNHSNINPVNKDYDQYKWRSAQGNCFEENRTPNNQNAGPIAGNNSHFCTNRGESVSNRQGGNPFSANGNQALLDERAKNNKKLKIGIAIGVLLFIVIVGSITAYNQFQHNLKLEEGRMNRLMAEERHRTNMQIIQMNQKSLERRQTARQKLEILKKRIEMEDELNRNRWNMSEFEIKIAQDRINRLKQQEN